MNSHTVVHILLFTPQPQFSEKSKRVQDLEECTKNIAWHFIHVRSVMAPIAIAIASSVYAALSETQVKYENLDSLFSNTNHYLYLAIKLSEKAGRGKR